MSKIFKDRITKAIDNADLKGFTIAIEGNIQRYVVANTRNTPTNQQGIDIDRLTAQAETLFLSKANVNVCGRLDETTNKLHIDISTSFNDLKEAIDFASETKQIAIWDNLNMQEIRLY